LNALFLFWDWGRLDAQWPQMKECWDSRLHGRGKLLIFQRFTPFVLFPAIITSTPCGGAKLAHYGFDYR